jgi:hypothetical protein
MAIGNQATPAGLYSQLTQLSLNLREVMQDISDFNLFVGQLGAAGLEAAPISMDSTDAAALVAAAAILNTPAAVYFGTATQAAEYNFNNALAPYWAGQ